MTRDELDQALQAWRNKLTNRDQRATIGQDDIAYVVSKSTGVPVTRLEEAETTSGRASTLATTSS